MAAFLIKLLYVPKNLFPISQKKLEQSINLNHVYDRPFIRYNLHQINHGTIIQTTITCKKIIYKSLLNLACLWSRARLAVNKNQRYFSLSDHQLAERLILAFGF